MAMDRSNGKVACTNQVEQHSYDRQNAIFCNCADYIMTSIVASGLSRDMTVEEFRRSVLSLIDDALGRSWIVRGDNRRLLQALRTYIPTAPDAELEKLMLALP